MSVKFRLFESCSKIVIKRVQLFSSKGNGSRVIGELLLSIFQKPEDDSCQDITKCRMLFMFLTFLIKCGNSITNV